MRISYEKFILNEGHYKKVKDSYDKESKTIEVESNFVEFDFNFNGKVDHIKLFTSNDNLDTYHLVIDDKKFGLIFLESLEIEDKESIGYESKKIRNHYKKDAMNSEFLPQKGNYKKLIVYQKAECIYDITYYFAHKFLEKGDRTIDQMIQAARSGKQNIAEGSAASTTSKETELKLVNVARASLQELLLDYEDYLRVRNLKQWEANNEKSIKTRMVCSRHNESLFYRNAIALRSDETVANIAITMIHQTDVFLRKLTDRLKADFMKRGGIKEEMYKARIEWRKKNC